MGKREHVAITNISSVSTVSIGKAMKKVDFHKGQDVSIFVEGEEIIITRKKG